MTVAGVGSLLLSVCVYLKNWCS